MSYLASLVAVFGVLVIATKMHNNDDRNRAQTITMLVVLPNMTLLTVQTVFAY